MDVRDDEAINLPRNSGCASTTTGTILSLRVIRLPLAARTFQPVDDHGTELNTDHSAFLPSTQQSRMTISEFNESGHSPESSQAEPPKALAAEDNLPPVEPPGAGFIMQLFLIPMFIVGIVLMVWLLFSWLAHMGSRPEDLVADFERLNGGTWQKALTLANLLRDESDDSVRRDEQLAERLSEILQKELDRGRPDEDHVRFRMYLCRALGEFEIDAGLPTLLEAARAEKSSKDVDVRRAALEAVAILADRIGAETVEQNDQLMPVLRQASRDLSQPDAEARGKLRSRAAFVLGILQSEEARNTLTLMAADPYPFARYNAVVGLARHGDARAVHGLLDMLPPTIGELEKFEQDDSGVEWSRNQIILNGLRATRLLLEANPGIDVTPLETALNELLDGEVSGAVEVEAKDVLRTIQEHKSSPAS